MILSPFGLDDPVQQAESTSTLLSCAALKNQVGLALLLSCEKQFPVLHYLKLSHLLNE